MKQKRWTRNSLWLLLPVAVFVFEACDSDRPSGGSDSVQKATVTETGQGKAADSTGTAADISSWIVDRYGPESGIVTYEVRFSGEKSRQTWYFRKHGLQEARYWELAGEGLPALTHITILDSAQVVVRGPGDPKPVRSAWTPDPKTVLPNFRNLTPEMRRIFSLNELPKREILGKKCNGYRLRINETVSDVWVWEGIMLYGELQGARERGIEPIIMQAALLKTDVSVPAEKFRVEG